MKWDDLSEMLKALGDDRRLEILELLQGGSMTASALLEHLAIGQSTLSHHMQQLCRAGLVSAKKDGKWTYYILHPEAIRRCADRLTHFSYVHRTTKSPDLPPALL